MADMIAREIETLTNQLKELEDSLKVAPTPPPLPSLQI